MHTFSRAEQAEIERLVELRYERSVAEKEVELKRASNPRAAGFNYGAPLPEPDLWSYRRIKAFADRYRQRNSETAREKSWELDMLIRAVRHSVYPYEQRLALASLLAFAQSEFNL